MDAYQVVGEVAHSWIFALRGLTRPLVREPFFILGAVQLLLLIALGYFHVAGVVGVLEPVVRWSGGEPATHYPGLFWALPEVYRTASLLISLLLAPPAFAVATLRFAGRRGYWSDGFRRMPRLLGLALIGPGVAWGITSLFNLVPLKIVMSSFVVRLGLQGIELGLIILLYAGLAYTTAFLMLEARPLPAAVRESLRLARSTPVVTMLSLVIPFGILFPITFFLFEMNLATSGLVPEAVGLLLAMRIVLQLGLSALLVGGFTATYLTRSGAAR